MFVRRIVTASVLFLLAGIAARATEADPFLWLENVNGPRSQAWVKAENAKTLAVMQNDPRFDAFYEDALAINEATDRVPTPEIINGTVYNFWQDATHVRGIWRSTSLADYGNPSPTWTTVLDLDALAKSENANWIWGGANCDSPSGTRCLIELSDGGEDAKTIREFDLPSKSFVSDGFVLPRGKQNVAWVSDDTVLVAREWTPGDLTASGYPFILKSLKRGQPLDAATEVFRGTKSDVSVSPMEINDGNGHRLVGFERGVSFFDSEKYILNASGAHKLDLPLESSIDAMVAGRVLVKLEQVWSATTAVIPQGSLVALSFDKLESDPDDLRPTIVYQPGSRETLLGVAVTRDRMIATTLENVNGRAFSYTPLPDGTWSRKRLDLPDNSSIAIVDADDKSSNAFVRVSSFLTPTTMWLIDTNTGKAAAVKSPSPKFDSAGDVVEQHEATSKDGTRVPYFIVHAKNTTLDGRTPTIMTAYGGFNVSETPTYDGTLGKLWLERGGAYVLANIRGGGEFGPAWHDAGLKTHRQRIYDDFAAVAHDLIARKYTSPRHLGIEGGSNGGLLMGVEFTQHPELWNAVFIAVPLLDMLRFEHIAAGASWVGEYGSVSNPAERAFLASISPYNNLRAGVKYPKPFLFTTTKDDRVGPQHARKFAAKLAAMHDPYYFYEVVEGGHASGANIKERSFTAALTYTYFTQQLTAQ
jgi:prolyl oligopeptidase